MPTFKHPCPQCDTLIERTVPACPACGFERPFGSDAQVRARPPSTAAAPARTAPDGPRRQCTGCGAALPAGARFCQECGTLTNP